MGAKVSFRVGIPLWGQADRCRELVRFLRRYRDTVCEVAFFTGVTHPPVPLGVLQERAAQLAEIMPRFRKAGLAAGINHLSTMGHLDENLEHSLAEPWQHLVDLSGAVSPSCYCTADPDMRDYVRQCYRALALAKPEFIWVDDDVRLESHGGIRWACFCDRCLAEFGAETGRAWTREELAAAFGAGRRDERLAVRRQWLQHNRDYIGRLLADIRAAVDAVDPALPLGLMTGESAYSGYGFAGAAAALAGPRRVEVRWRPGGGFYSDENPPALLGKAHSVGRQIALLPPAVRDVQYEHENFPYQVLRKSQTLFVAEAAAALGAGCTGVALNCMGITPDPFGEYEPRFRAMRAARPLLDAIAATCGRRPCEGVWIGFTRDHAAALRPDHDWAGMPGWASDLATANELAEIGLPFAYGPEGARVTLLAGDAVLDFPPAELRTRLAGGVLLDGPGLRRLEELGLGDLTGFRVRGTKEKDTLERFTDDPLNAPYAGWHRDCRPSFWADTSYLLEATAAGARPLAEVIDFVPQSFGPCSGAFENRLGGRVAVLGHFPWRSVSSLAKASQMRTLCRWLSRDTLPAWVSSFHRAALWCRRDEAGRPAVLVLNACADATSGLSVRIREAPTALTCRGLRGPVRRLQATAEDGPYREFRLPRLAPWTPAFLYAAE